MVNSNELEVVPNDLNGKVNDMSMLTVYSCRLDNIDIHAVQQWFT